MSSPSQTPSVAQIAQPTQPTELVSNDDAPFDDTEPKESRSVSSSRYEDRRLIGLGGMGEVRRVYDKRLRRNVAMKILREPFQSNRIAVQRFLEEAQVAAQLAHPNIVPVHDLGFLSDGRAFFTMDEVRGRTLGRVIKELHRASASVWHPTPDGWTVRKLIEAIRQVCEAMGYAHNRGVLHRDLKPDNIMMGKFGEVLVMDWGLAKIMDSVTPEEPILVKAAGRGVTQAGAVAGTPAYMAPEQARGEHSAMDCRSDVYALGAILYEILDGQPPYAGKEALAHVLSRPPTPLTAQATGRRSEPGPPIPSGLRRITARAMSRNSADRYADASEMARALDSWLDGSKKRANAMQLVRNADELAPEVDRLERAARALRERARLMLKGLTSDAPISAKRQAWALEERASALQTDAELKNVDMLEKLRAALNEAPDTKEAHTRLAAHYAKRHQGAVNRRDHRAQVALEALLDTHDVGEWTDYLRGLGHLNLNTDRSASVTMRPLILQDRRLVHGPARAIGRTPIDLEIRHGSYLLDLEDNDGNRYQIPLYIERRGADFEHPPIDSTITVLPPKLTENEVWIAPGWTTIGGDGLAPGAGPRTRVWLGSRAIQRYPVTNQQFLTFLQSVREREGTETAMRWAPRLHDQASIESLTYDWDGLDFSIPATLSPDAPVTHISWDCANAYARWFSEATGQHWRLPTEVEWEKAARGIDGRFYPWGDLFDHAFCRVRNPERTHLMPDPATHWPEDVSVYGVYGMGGNAREWCHDGFEQQLNAVDGEKAPAPDDTSADLRSIRGGSFTLDERYSRCASRDWAVRLQRSPDLTFRLIRELE